MGFIKVDREILSNPIVNKDAEYFSIWMYLLLKAAYVEKEKLFNGKKILLEKGQLITGRKAIASHFNISESKVQRVLKSLEIEQQIEQVTCPKNRLIKVLNWSKYQNGEQQEEQQLNNKRTTTEQQLNTNKEVLRIKEEKELKNKTYIGVLSSYTSNTELLETLKCFVDMRKAMKGYTVRALELNLKKLDKIAIDDDTKIGIVNQTIENSWKSFFPLKLQSQEKEVMPF